MMRTMISIFLSSSVWAIRRFTESTVITMRAIGSKHLYSVASQNPRGKSIFAKIVSSGKRDPRDFIWLWRNVAGGSRNWLALLSFVPKKEILLFDDALVPDVQEFADKYGFDVGVGRAPSVEEEILEHGILSLV